jgi:hypothetical protein
MKKSKGDQYSDHDTETSLTIRRNDGLSLHFVVQRDHFEIVGFRVALMTEDASIISIEMTPEELCLLKSLLGSIDCKLERPAALVKMCCGGALRVALN